MNYLESLFTETRHLIADLGKDGGLISPSIYDTAQVLRFAPPEDVQPVIEWLLAQQHADGGWSNPAVPLARHVPTLASILALHNYQKDSTVAEACCLGMIFLQKHAGDWLDMHLNDLPIGVEIIFPKLLEEAREMGLQLTWQPYEKLMLLGQKKRRKIAQMNLAAGTPPTFSWEAWGTEPSTIWLDELGSVGTSPSATSKWLYLAKDRPDLAADRAKATNYLQRAAAATGTGIPGIVPNVWPINRFEQQYSLYVLLVAGLFDHPALKDVISRQVQDLVKGFRSTGISWNDYFMADGDDTAMAIMVLQQAGYDISALNILHDFRYNHHFCTFVGELNPSIFCTAHAIHALARTDVVLDEPLMFLLENQYADGRWMADKWHSSWLYTTLEVILALDHSGQSAGVRKAVEALLYHQHSDGGWGMNGKSTNIETAYTVLALFVLEQQAKLPSNAISALKRGKEWLISRYQPFTLNREDKFWIGKELYKPYRIDRMFEITTLLMLAIQETERNLETVY